jgi:hypothetical protein
MYSQNIILIGTVCSQDKSLSSINWQLKITNFMKIVAALAICLNTLFMAASGVHEDKKSGFAKDYPWLFDNSSFIGLKIPDFDNGKKLTHSEILDERKEKLFF